MRRFHARSHVELGWTVITSVPGPVERVSAGDYTPAARPTVVERSSVGTTARSPAPTSARLVVARVRTDATTAAVLETVAARASPVESRASGFVNTSAVVGCVMSHVIVRAVITRVPDVYHVDTSASGSVVRRVLPSAASVIVKRSPNCSSDSRMNRTLDSSSWKTASTCLRCDFISLSNVIFCDDNGFYPRRSRA